MTGTFWSSAFVAALFAIHPLHVESVAWISERKDVLSTLFWFLTMGAYLRYVRNPNTSRYLLNLALFALGLMAKPMLVTLPFVLLLLDYWPLNRFENKIQFYNLVREKTPFFILSAASSIVTFVFQKNAGAIKEMGIFPLKLRMSNTVISYVRYIEKMVWPDHLAVFYPYSVDYLLMPLTFAAAAILLIVTFLVIRLGKRCKYLLVGWFWYIGTLVPVIGLIQVGGQSMADRYTYVPLIGLFIIIAWGTNNLLEKWKYRKIVLSVSALVIISILSVRACSQTAYWRNSTTLFEHALKATSRNYVASYSLGTVLLQQNKFDEAINYFQKALKIQPNYSKALNNLALAYANLGRYAEARELYKRVLKIKPDMYEAYINWSALLVELSQKKQSQSRQDLLDEATDKCLKAESIKTGSASYNLACISALQGNKIRCREWLKLAEQAGTLPSREHAMSDTDLETVRNEEWFKQIRWSNAANVQSAGK
jgi:tetratricopeptide (TPR) repeat protein